MSCGASRDEKMLLISVPFVSFVFVLFSAK